MARHALFYAAARRMEVATAQSMPAHFRTPNLTRIMHSAPPEADLKQALVASMIDVISGSVQGV